MAARRASPACSASILDLLVAADDNQYISSRVRRECTGVAEARAKQMDAQQEQNRWSKKSKKKNDSRSKETRGKHEKDGPLKTVRCIELPQTHCSSESDLMLVIENCTNITLVIQDCTKMALDSKLFRERATRLCTYSLGKHWTYLPSDN